MQEYQELVSSVLHDGRYRENRTAVDTISSFHETYEIDVSEGFPLLTTKQMSDYRWNSLIHELLWYLSGEHHIRELREETKIWDAWADEEDWTLPSAYGRFWRRYPVPEDDSQLPGEAWAGTDCPWVYEEDDGALVFDQIGYVVDTLNGDNPHRGSNSRRLIVNAWHPANAAVSALPPCHYSFTFNVQGDRLNLSLHQRSGDVALGIPFNIAAYSIVLTAVARQTGYEPGEFGHTIDDAHIYCGDGDRGSWYADNLSDLQNHIEQVSSTDDRWATYADISEWIREEAPAEDEGSERLDHVPGLLRQLDREPLSRPTLEIADKPLDELEFDDVELHDYESHDGIRFGVAE